MKHKPGTVGIEEKQGKLRLRLPRSVAEGSCRYISTGLESTPENYRTVQLVAWQIDEDIRQGNLDVTLGKYKDLFQKTDTFKVSILTLDITELWAKYCEYRKPQVTVTTYYREYASKYTNHIQKLPTKDLRKAVDIRDYLLKNTSPDTAKRVLTYLNACCRWAVESGIIKQNPFEGMPSSIRVPVTKDIDPFSYQEREAILLAFSEHPRYRQYLPFVRFLFLTGCRIGEAIALQWRNISNDCSEVTFAETYCGRCKVRKPTKTGKVRKFPCNPVLQQLLLDIRPTSPIPTQLVFTTSKGKPIDNVRFTNNIWRGYQDTRADKYYPGIVTKLADEGLISRYRCPYNCRHTFITMVVEAGIPIPQIAKWVGNSPEIILRHYAGCLAQPEVPVK